MKRILSYKVILVFVVLTLTACTMVHKGQIVSLDYGQAVNPQNQAVGTYSVNYVFGLGGTSTTVMLKEAKDDLIRNRPLKEGEKYVNVNLNSSTFFFLFFTIHRYTITADVLSTNPILKDSSLQSIDNPIKTKSFFEVGDSLFSTFGYEGLYVSQTDYGKIKFINTKEKIEYLNKNNLFKKLDCYKGFKIGQDVKVSVAYPNSAIIVGFGLTKVLLQDSEKTMLKMKYDNIKN
jgi:hypothetical protein